MSTTQPQELREAMKQAADECLDLTVGKRGSSIRVQEATFGCSVYLRWPTPAHVDNPYYSKKLPPVRGADGELYEERVRTVLSQAYDASRRRLEGQPGFKDEDEAPVLLVALADRFMREYTFPSDRRKNEIAREKECLVGFLDHEGKRGIPAEDVDPPLLWRLWEKRKSGEIDSRGNLIEAEEARREISPRTASETVATVGEFFNWGMKLRRGGEPLLTWNPVSAMELPTNPNPTRVVCSDEKYERILKVAHKITESHNGKSRRAPFKEIWLVAAYTGHRRSAILNLRWDDWRPDLGRCGVLRWRAESDKAENEHVTPVLPPVRGALEAWRKETMAEGEGSRWIFPAFEADGHVRGDVVQGWVVEAEKLAGYDEHEKYFGLHSLRRRWAMKRKDLSPVDVAELGGWKNVETLQAVYQRADMQTMERVLEQGEKTRLAEV